jgi:hypothetical protein
LSFHIEGNNAHLKKESEIHSLKRQALVRSASSLKLMSEPNWKMTTAWVLQQHKLIRYGPNHPARFWNLEEIFEKGYWKYGKHYSHLIYCEHMSEVHLRNWADEHRHDFVWDEHKRGTSDPLWNSAGYLGINYEAYYAHYQAYH